MFFWKQVYICIKGQKVQICILFGVVFLVSTLISGALLVNQAIANTDVAIRSFLPAVAIVQPDEDSFFFEWNETGEWPFRENMTTSVLHEIGSLSYVRSFNFSVNNHNFYSIDLVRAWYPELFLKTPYPDHEAIDDDSLSVWHDTLFERFILNGVGNMDIFEVEFNVIELISGRTFNEYEIMHGMPVVIVSQSFLNTNNLVVGDALVIDHIVKNYNLPIEDQFQADTFLAREAYEFEIIGAFNRELTYYRDLYGIDIQEHHWILNEIFVPATFVEFITSVELEIHGNEEVAQRYSESERILDALDFRNIYFLLYDPLYLQDFHLAANEILPDFWKVSDYSFAYNDVAQAMVLIREVSDGLLVGGIVAMLIILSLVILLFLSSRIKEIGIYLTLGKQKRKILGQIMVEIFIPTILAITSALFSGNILSSQISSRMLRSYIADVETSTLVIEEMQIPGFRHGLINEEMVEMFEVAINIQTALIFYSLGLGIVFLSTFASGVHILRMNPKKILTNDCNLIE